MIIGPILNRSGEYRFDIWTAAKGASLGYTTAASKTPITTESSRSRRLA